MTTRQNETNQGQGDAEPKVEVLDVRYSVECHLRGTIAKDLSRREADALAKLNAGAILYAHI